MNRSRSAQPGATRAKRSVPAGTCPHPRRNTVGIGAIGVNHVAVNCRDVRASMRFYVDVLGLRENTSLGGA
ncbi:MAG: hypothetical protein GF331_13920 [Chitinivibrionales bacterium]|nr:hypothetical protein [Chitinivibrionales bacterium]